MTRRKATVTPSGESDWTVEESLPVKRTRKPRVDPEIAAVITACLADGKVRSRTFPDKHAAHLMGRRLRRAAIAAGGKVALRYEESTDGCKLFFVRDSPDV